ncbi:MAG: MerR family transcriptional regulator [Bacillota bacterium]
MNYYSIGEAANKLGISIDTLRRWDKKGILRSYRFGGQKGHRYFSVSDIELQRLHLSDEVFNWVTSNNASEPDNSFYCSDSSIFQQRLGRMEIELNRIDALKNEYSLITSSIGEIGNNSFDHNIGSWPDIRGIFFAYDTSKRQAVLADRGQGILTTLKRVRPELINDKDALILAFTEKVSGRAPESRGNGLKFVRRAISLDANEIPLKLYFQTGDAALFLEKGDRHLDVHSAQRPFRGCLAIISF